MEKLKEWFFRHLALGVFPEWSLICAELFIVGALLFYFLSVRGHLSSSPADWEAFGAYFGGVVAPAVSFLSVIALVTSIRLQRDGLKDQEKQIADQNAQLKDQQERFATEQFNSIFFGLLGNHYNVVNSYGRGTETGAQRLEDEGTRMNPASPFPPVFMPFVHSVVSMLEHVDLCDLEIDQTRYFRIILGTLTDTQKRVINRYSEIATDNEYEQQVIRTWIRAKP